MRNTRINRRKNNQKKNQNHSKSRTKRIFLEEPYRQKQNYDQKSQKKTFRIVKLKLSELSKLGNPKGFQQPN
jgi:hypothetical protein